MLLTNAQLPLKMTFLVTHLPSAEADGGIPVQTSPDTRVCKCATSFPSLVGIGATFNRSLFKQMGDVMGDEARAYYTVLKGETNMVM